MEISTMYKELYFKTVNSSWRESGEEVLECINKLLCKELEISEDDFFSNYSTSTFSFELHPDYLDIDVFDSFKLYSNKDIIIELHPKLLEKLFKELTEILKNNGWNPSEEEMIYTIDGSLDSVSIYEVFESCLDHDSLKKDEKTYSINLGLIA